jgi:hypothetical protein
VPHPGNVANDCVELLHGDQGPFGYGIKMHNTCSFPIAITWCAISKDHHERWAKGFDQTATLMLGEASPVDALEGNQVSSVRFGACKGAGTLLNVDKNGSRMVVECGGYPS